MNDIKLAVLGSEGVGKSALIVRFLTRRFIGEYASLSECIYRKRLALGGRQINVELYDPCSQVCAGTSALRDQIHWGDAFLVVYDISDRSSFQAAKNILHLTRELHPAAGKRDGEPSAAATGAGGAAGGRRPPPPPPPPPTVVLVGNKQDLCHVREVSRDEGRRLADDHRCCLFLELSAAEHGQEVALAFSSALQGAAAGAGGKAKEQQQQQQRRGRRPSGSRAMCKLITNVFGKRRKSV